MFELKNKLRTTLLKFLDIPKTYLACDINMHSDSEMILIRYHKGKMDVIGEYKSKSRTYRGLLFEISRIARMYNVQPNDVLLDSPMEASDYGRT